MRKIFDNYSLNKNVDRAGVNSLLRNIRKRTKTSSIIVFSAFNISGEQINESWLVKKKGDKCEFSPMNVKSDFAKLSFDFKTSILNYLLTSNMVIVILICNMNQKIDKKKTIKEMWGFKVENKKKKTVFSQILSEEIYKYCTTNAYTGKEIPPQKELVYCGPDGKICGWDMI